MARKKGKKTSKLGKLSKAFSKGNKKGKPLKLPKGWKKRITVRVGEPQYSTFPYQS